MSLLSWFWSGAAAPPQTTAAGAAQGTATAAAVGRATTAAVGSAHGTGTATGFSTAASVGSAAATGTATGVGRAFKASVGSATATAPSTAVGAVPISAAVGAVGPAIFRPTTAYTFAWDPDPSTPTITSYEWRIQPGPDFVSVGLATSVVLPDLVYGDYVIQVRACNAEGCSTPTTTPFLVSRAYVAGYSTSATGVGRATSTSTASGFSATTGAAGTATGTGTATAVGRATRATVGSATGTGTASGISATTGLAARVGAAAGVGTALGVSKQTRATVGSAHGTGTATGAAYVISTLPGVFGGIRLEFALPSNAFLANGFPNAAFGGTAWVNVLSDTRAEDPIVLDYGVTGNGPDDRVGSAGTLTFTLNNAADNQGGVTSYYSPLHPSRRSGFDLNIPVRLVFQIGVQDYHKFLGRLSDVNPEPGRYGTYRVPCTAVDLMDDWAANDMPVVMPILQDKNAGQLLSQLFSALEVNAPDLLPSGSSLEPGIDVLPFAFHDPNRRTIRELIIDAVMSEFGFASFRGSSESGGLFLFQNRHAPSTYPIDMALINQFSIDSGFQATQSRDAIASSIEVFAYPTSSDTTPVDIFLLAGEPILVTALQTVTVHLAFKSPAHLDTPVAALELLTIEPYVDYTMASHQDGTGDDLTPYFAVSHVYPSGGFEAVITITNLGGLPAFVTLLKGRGRGLYIAEASAKVTLDSVYGRRPLQIVMPWQSNVNTASDIAHFFGTIYRNPFAQVNAVRFCANKTQTLLDAAIFLEPGAFIYIQEDVTGIAGTFRIQGVHLEYSSGILWCTWRLQSVDRQTFWLLGIADRSEIGFTTLLGF